VSVREIEGLPWPEGDPGALRAIAGHATRLAVELGQHEHTTFGLTPTSMGWLGDASDAYAISLAEHSHALGSGASAMRDAATALLTLAGAVEDGQRRVLKAARLLKEARDDAATASQHAAALRQRANDEATFGASLGNPLATGALGGPSLAEIAARQAETAADTAQFHALDVQSSTQPEAQDAYDDVQRADRACANALEDLHLVGASAPSLPGPGGPASPALAALGALLLGSGARGDPSLLALLCTPAPPPPPPPKPAKHHNWWKLGAAGLLGVATAALTVADIAQLGLDPITDGATVATAAETAALGEEAIAGEAALAETAAAGEAATAEAGEAATLEELTAAQASNFGRYAGKLPAGRQAPTITRLSDGSVRFSSDVPGRVPGSYANYTKTVDAAGKTTGYVKTTYAPDGSVVHVKVKFP
jgi:hypothetical protein